MSETAVAATDEAVLIDFVAPLPGLGDVRRFALTPLDGTHTLFTLRSVDPEGLRLFLIPPELYFADYAPRLDSSVRAAIGVGQAEPAVFAIVHPATETDGPTANLLAPIVVNPTTGAAMQAVLDGASWPLRAPLPAP